MIRWYIMPRAATPIQRAGRSYFRPDYLDALAPGATWAWMPVTDGWGIGWVDLTATQHSNYSANSDVRFLTANLDNSPTAAAVTAIQTALDNRNLPSAWVTTALTWRQIIRRVLRFVLCAQRFYGEAKVSLILGRVRTTRINSLTQETRDHLRRVATSLNVPGADEVNDDIEALLTKWADNLQTREIVVGGIRL